MEGEGGILWWEFIAVVRCNVICVDHGSIAVIIDVVLTVCVCRLVYCQIAD